jgi:hypothetical protein
MPAFSIIACYSTDGADSGTWAVTRGDARCASQVLDHSAEAVARGGA